MVAARFIILSVATLVSATFPNDGHFFASLLKRQEPGTPSYNCHDNCGSAITISKAGGDVCKNGAFTADYKNCLQCAGPDNFNIWRMYGNTLSKIGQGCGLSTTPASGKQPDVGPAQHPGASPSSSTPTSTTSSSLDTVGAPRTSSPASTIMAHSSTGSVVAPTVSSTPTASRNGTSSFTSSQPAQQTSNAASALEISYAAVGAMAMGVMFGLSN